MRLCEDIYSSIRRYLCSHDLRQVMRFGIVGFSNFLVSFTVYYLVYRYGKISNILHKDGWLLSQVLSGVLDSLRIKTFDGAFANICGYSAGIVNSFFWNKTWTFDVKHQTARQFKRFLMMNVFCLALSTLGIFIFVDLLQGPYKLVWFLVGGVTILLNYFGYKHWVFQKSAG